MIKLPKIRKVALILMSVSSVLLMKVETLAPDLMREAVVVPAIVAPALAVSTHKVSATTTTTKFSLNDALGIKATPRYQGSMRKFLDAMARSESNNISDTVNALGMMGKYQFSVSTLKRLGLNIDRETFLQNEALQDSAMMINLKYNFEHLYPIIRTYNRRWVNGVYVTTSGILAGAHLVGIGGVRTFFYPNLYRFRTVDANGTSVANYMMKFANYRISFN